jgi:hypothetical protein
MIEMGNSRISDFILMAVPRDCAQSRKAALPQRDT